ncbi:MAG: GrpE protein [Magnetococcales bacterium]|nr:GrpE protein [Magnetococcales bacterium]HIJ85968.1 nucleotide exchange factor GrpE [Magnetococcales bacterium]
MTDQNYPNDKVGDHPESGGPQEAATVFSHGEGIDLATTTDEQQDLGQVAEPDEGALREELAQLKQKLEETEAALAASRGDTLRVHADMQNLRKRTAREVQQARDFALEGFARDLLRVSDNMERALNAMPDVQDGAIKAMADGVGMVQAELKRIFESHGVVRIETAGKPFDANLHQAVQEVDAPEAQPGTIVAEFQPGFLLNGRLLRASMVVVARVQAT